MQDENTLREVAKDCVHCGFCLPACPTYQLWAEEMDSPRGRIYLVNQILDGAPLSAAAAEHFDRCLGCMACMTACPSGVQYDQLIEAARVWTEEARPGRTARPWSAGHPRERTACGSGRRGRPSSPCSLPQAAAGADRAAAGGAADRARPPAGRGPACRGGCSPALGAALRLAPPRVPGAAVLGRGRCPSACPRSAPGGPWSACSPDACSRCSSRR